MSEQTDLPNQYQPVAVVRTLLQAIQQPLGMLEEALQTPEQLLRELTPALEVVNFAPFAQLTVTAAEANRPAPKPPPRSTATLPVVPALVSAPSQPPHMTHGTAMQPDGLPQTTLSTDPAKPTAPPIFALAGQKQTITSVSPPMPLTVGASTHPLIQPAARPTTVLTANEAEMVVRSAPLSGNGPGGMVAMPLAPLVATDPTTSYPGTQYRNGVATAAPSLSTLAVLATVVDSLLSPAPVASVEPVVPEAASRPGASSLAVPSSSPSVDGWQWPEAMMPGVHSLLRSSDRVGLPFRQPPAASTPMHAPTPDPSTLLTGWPSVEDEDQLTNQPTLDAWTLAQLINDVLAEEARRHGVDLS